MLKVVAIIQARLGSTRLPEKVMHTLVDKPMLQHVVERTTRSRLVDSVVVATTNEIADQPLVEFCEQNRWNVFAGSERDVLERYWQCANQFDADYIVRITSDCPLASPEIIDKVIASQIKSDANYTCNFHPKRTFPRGLEVECFTRETLDRVHKSAVEPNLREHVTLMIYNRPDLFKLKGIRCPIDLSDWRWTVDTADDMKLIRKIYDHFGDNRFTWRQAAQLVHENPSWQILNQHIRQKAA